MHQSVKNKNRSRISAGPTVSVNRSRRLHDPCMQALEARLLFSAQTIHVTTTADTTSGPTSLRQAVAIANANPGSTIILDNSGTYTLSNSSVDGDTDLDITANVTIASKSGVASKVIIDGGLSDQIFDFAPNVSATINSLTLQNGLTSGRGGAISLPAGIGSLTLNGDILNYNTSQLGGGGVYVGDGNTLTINNSTFNFNNAGGNGGAVAYEGADLNVYNSTFYTNQSGLDGGAIYQEPLGSEIAKGMYLNEGTFRDNTAADYGGAVYFEAPSFQAPNAGVRTVTAVILPTAGADVSVKSSLFSDNNSGDEGGGLYVASATLNLVQDVTAQVPVANNPVALTISGTTFTGNFGSSGGGAYAQDVASISVDHSTFTNNKGSYSGGGLTVYDNHLPGTTTVKVTYSTFTGNSASSGGGIFVSNVSSLTVDHSNISTNRATYDGGGIYYEGARNNDLNQSVSMTLTNDTISGNRVGSANKPNSTFSDAGGGVYFAVVPQFGTGYVLVSPVLVNITGNTISGNTIGGPGGGIFLSDADTTQPFQVTVKGNTFSGNSATGFSGTAGEGAGMFIKAVGTSANSIAITNDTFSTNRATNDGGGLYLSVAGGTTSVTGSTFNNNVSAADGGGVGVGLASQGVKLVNDTLSGNTAAHAGGGLYADPNSNVSMIYLTIALNKATLGGGVFNGGGVVSVLDSIIATNTLNNSNLVNGPDVEGIFSDLGHNLIGISDGSSGFTTSTLVGTSALPINPQLSPLANNGGPTQTMALSKTSPARSAGIYVVGVQTDQRGVTRPSIPDIGAYQHS